MSSAALPEVIDVIRAEAFSLRDFCAALEPAGWSRPSACAGWTVGDVCAHLTQGAQTWTASLHRALRGDANPPAGERTLQPGERGSEVTAQRAIALRQEMGAAALLQAFTEGHEHFHQLLLTVQATDWDKPSYHRRGNMSVGQYIILRLQELTIHGWDIRSAFDVTAALSDRPLPLLMTSVQRWLTHAFRPVPALPAPIRYRFDTSGPSVVQQDIVVSQDGLRLEAVAAHPADVMFHCSTSDALLLIYGRLAFERATEATGWQIQGDPAQAALFPTLFQGF